MWTDEDWTLLLAALNPESRDRLEKTKPPEQWQLVALWCRHAWQHFRPAPRNMRGGPPRVDDEGLADFFEKLPGDQRDRLLNLPGEEMHRALLQLYLRQARPSDGPGSRGEGPKGRGKRPMTPGNPEKEPSPADR
jgi:hypothetical protein